MRSADEETIELPKAPFFVLSCAIDRAIHSPKIMPSSSPRSIRQPPFGPFTAAAQRSASGSLAITKSAPTSRAFASAKSIAPGSSGFGNATVGKSGSGSACSLTKTKLGNPALANTFSTVSVPTPCIAVYTILREPGRGASFAVRATYLSTTTSSKTVHDLPLGTSLRELTKSISFAIKPSVGLMICDAAYSIPSAVGPM